MSLFRSVAGAAVTLLAVVVGAPANAMIIHYTSDLTQDKEVPASSPLTGATGHADFIYNDQGNGIGADDVLSWVITYSVGLFPGTGPVPRTSTSAIPASMATSSSTFRRIAVRRRTG